MIDYLNNTRFRRMVAHPIGIAAVLILLLGWFLRIHDLDVSSLWLDEVRSFSRASLPNWQVGRAAMIQANHAPLYEWLVLRTWLNVGRNEFLARFPGVILGLLTLSVTYSLGNTLFNKKVTLWAILFLALSPLNVRFTRWIRPYALLSLLLTLTIYYLWRAMSTGRRRYWLAFSILGVSALYTHYFAVFTLAGLGLFVLVRAIIDRNPTIFAHWLLSNAVIAVLFLPWFSSFQTELADGAVEWIEPLSLSTFLQLPTNFVAWDLFSSPIWTLLTVLIWFIFVLGFTAWIRFRSPWSGKWRYPYIAMIYVATVLLVVFVSLVKPLFVPRYFLGVLPVACILLAFSIVNGRPRHMPSWLGIIILIASLFSSIHLITRHSSEPWKEVAAYIEAHGKSDEKLVFFGESLVWMLPFQHYYKGNLLPQFFAGELDENLAVETAIATQCPCARLWLIQSARHTSVQSLSYEPDDEYAGYQLTDRVRFDQNLLKERFAVDVWLLEEIGR